MTEWKRMEIMKHRLSGFLCLMCVCALLTGCQSQGSVAACSSSVCSREQLLQGSL